ncbi:YifB family Mg chelatase-like AAA ATPase [bacterium]|nr:YifB family Mg chelatase-like AAA ATPase [bacterium]
MTTSQTFTATIIGIDAHIIEVEADISLGLGGFNIVGLPDGTIKESRERIMAALNNSYGEFPIRKVIVNLAPADIKKVGTGFDLPIALTVLEASRQIPTGCLESYLIIGELSLEGKIRPVEGILAVALAAKKAGITTLIVPTENGSASALVSGLTVLTASHLEEVFNHFSNRGHLTEYVCKSLPGEEVSPDYQLDFSDVKGQESAKRTLEIAAAGRHNVLLSGPPGSGKSMLSKRLPSILPALTFEEALEVTKIHSIAGTIAKDHHLVTTRPFRHPHHSASGAGLIGGGSSPKPGEVSLAHHGVLFLDELPEFPRSVLDLLRQPLEDKKVVISRAVMSLSFPSDYILLAAMNPCPCGYLGDGGKECLCSAASILKYRSKISGPLLDRIDLQIEMPALSYEEINFSKRGESSQTIRDRVLVARAVQLERFSHSETQYNANMNHKEVERYCQLRQDGHDLLSCALTTYKLSGRAHDSILKVARTIADLEESERVETRHLSEAVNYRCLDKELHF